MRLKEIAFLVSMAAVALAEWPLAMSYRPDPIFFFGLPFIKCAGMGLIAFLVLTSNQFRTVSEPPSGMNWLIAGFILVSSIFMDLFFLSWALSDV